MKIALIGAGNVAWHLSKAAMAGGHQVVAIYSRTVATAEALAKNIEEAKVITTPDLTSIDVDVAIIAVPDAAVATIAGQLKVNHGTIIVHTSGSLPMQVLQSIDHTHVGVFYPLQTFSKEKDIDFKQVPILLEATDADTLHTIKTLAESLSQQVLEVSSEKRRHLHLAAVFACNFTNHLLGISREVLQEVNLPPELLQPLIQETIRKAAGQHPFKVQTGPAVRRDVNTIQAHLQMLQEQPQYQELYLKLTQSIQAHKK